LYVKQGKLIMVYVPADGLGRLLLQYIVLSL
jgi:hypothetical protein